MGPEYSDAKRKLLEKYLRGELGAASRGSADCPPTSRASEFLSPMRKSKSGFMRNWRLKFRFTTNR